MPFPLYTQSFSTLYPPFEYHSRICLSWYLLPEREEEKEVGEDRLSVIFPISTHLLLFIQNAKNSLYLWKFVLNTISSQKKERETLE